MNSTRSETGTVVLFLVVVVNLNKIFFLICIVLKFFFEEITSPFSRLEGFILNWFCAIHNIRPRPFMFKLRRNMRANLT